MFLPLDEREVKDGRGGRRGERGGIVSIVEGSNLRLGCRHVTGHCTPGVTRGAIRRDAACAFKRYEGWTSGV
ncbi:hypothetical protein [Paenibacillus oceani]|uniref:Uncharacterized protein n=1 Tax=Paenibacillus oceani TaxID=2772510 RepID=A0A927CC04_9BACL|nr:hypothetical protein [Paenibacillus oceani]MBD2864870.1 hypothetical protein [Paenibacillus oceani]